MPEFPTQFEFASWLAIRGRLSIEIGTGLRFKGRGILKIVNERFGTKFTRKQAAFDFMDEKIKTVQKAVAATQN